MCFLPRGRAEEEVIPQWPKCTKRLVVFRFSFVSDRNPPALALLLPPPRLPAVPPNQLAKYHPAPISRNRFSGAPCLSSNAAGEFDHDLIHGEGLWSWPDGSSYAGQAKHGVREGKGLYVTAMEVSTRKPNRREDGAHSKRHSTPGAEVNRSTFTCGT